MLPEAMLETECGDYDVRHKSRKFGLQLASFSQLYDHLYDV